MKIGVLSLTTGAKRLAGQLTSQLENAALLPVRNNINTVFTANWKSYDGFVCVMASGIVVRAIAPLLQNKKNDPCVVVVDERGENVISLIAGHLGGGNELARKVAALSGGRAIITTASDVLGLTPLDLWLHAQNIVPRNDKVMTKASARLVNNKQIRLFTELDIKSLPHDILIADRPEMSDIIISSSTDWPEKTLLFHPREFVLGIGCNRGVKYAEISKALAEVLSAVNISRLSIHNLASIDLKRDEKGLLEFAEANNWKIDFYTNIQLNSVKGIVSSQRIFQATGAGGVAEPAALLSAGSSNLFMEKRKWQNVTLALARANFTLSAPVPGT